jgi:hypothetical protein
MIAAAGAAGCSLLRGGTPDMPARIAVCETYTTEVCGTWTRRAGDVYAGTWDDGATGEIRLRRPNSVEIEATRTDSGKNPDLTAVYRGSVRDRTAAGQVTWTERGASRTGFWTAEW